MTGDNTFTHQHGGAFVREFTWRDSAGEPLDLTGRGVALEHTRFVEGLTVTVIDDANGRVRLEMTKTAADKIPFGRRAYFRVVLAPESETGADALPQMWVNVE